MNLLEAFSDIKEHCYYGNLAIDPIKNPIANSRDYIIEYLNIAEKGKVIPSEDYIKILDEEGRCRHMVSLYLMGIVIYEKHQPLQKAFDQLTEKCEKNIVPFETSKKRFLYIWFLSCLCHDLGYLYENKKCDVLKTLPRNLSYLFALYKILNGLKRYCKKDVLGVPRILLDNVSRYAYARFFNPKSKTQPVIDHAIAGGMLLYDTMKSYHLSSANSKNGKSPEIFCTYGRAAAWTIFCHNMWLAKDKESIQYYKNANLHALIRKVPPHALISWEEHPLLFLLSLLDTIEPLKIFSDNITTLEKIDISFKNKSIIFKFPDSIDGCRFKEKCSPSPDCNAQNCHKCLKKQLWFLTGDTFTVDITGKTLKLKFS